LATRKGTLKLSSLTASLLQIRDDGDTLLMLAEWIAFERRCCPFLRFIVTVDGGDRLDLTMSGDVGVKEFLRIELAGGALAPERLVKPRR
jgi:hypothetical protein